MNGVAGRVILVVGPDCHGCGVCVPVCPLGAIRMTTREREGGVTDPAAEIDVEKCDLCRKCLAVCPVEAIEEPYPPAWRELPAKP